MWISSHTLPKLEFTAVGKCVWHWLKINSFAKSVRVFLVTGNCCFLLYYWTFKKKKKKSSLPFILITSYLQ